MTQRRVRAPKSIRLRLTVAVATVFFLAFALVTTVGRQQLRIALLDGARSNAESLLMDYVTSPAGSGGGSPDQLTRFAFFGEEGNELSGPELEQMLIDSYTAQLPAFPDSVELFPGYSVDVVFDSPIVEAGPFESPFIVTGDLEPIDLGPGVVAAAVPVAIGDEVAVVAISTPTTFVDESLSIITDVALVLLPLLTALVAAATWATVGRALRPVEAIRRHVEQTDPTSLHHPIPQTGTGDEIDRLAGTMTDLLDRLHRAAVQQRQFISDASHELRSPITATLATIESTNHDLAAGDWPGLAKTLTNEQLRLAALVDDLLLLAHLDEHRAGGRTDHVDLDEIILAEAARHSQTTVRAQIEAPCRLVGSVRLLERCLSNLVDNAVRHADHEVIIKLEPQPHSILVFIDDDGCGVPVEEREAIFNRFRRLDESRTRTEGGAGLGLAIARNIAHQHGGEVICRQSPLGGARFELRLPAQSRSINVGPTVVRPGRPWEQDQKRGVRC